MQKKIETSESENLPVISGIEYNNTLPFDLPQMAAGLVHEVKNPLAAIHLHMQLLENYIYEVEDEDLRKRMLGKTDIIKRQIISLNQMLQEFIRLVRPRNPEKSPDINLDELIKEVIELMDVQALKEGIEITYRSGGPGILYGSDPAFIKQALINLILNSIQAFKNSDLAMENRKIEVESGRDEDMVFFRVTDNGPGIPKDILSRIFDPYFTTKNDGSGLGLALVKKMARELGGDVTVISSPDHGAEFSIHLPSKRYVIESKKYEDD